MKKIARTLLILIVALAGFSFSAWFFFPWDRAGEYALNNVAERAGQKGIEIEWSDIEKYGRLMPSIYVRDLRLGTFAVDMSIPNLRIQPLPFLSILKMVPSFSLDYDQGILGAAMGGLSPAYRTEGSLMLSSSGRNVELGDIDVSGDINVSGSATVEIGRARFSKADMTLEVPEKMEGVLYTLIGFMPLQRVRSGEWKLLTGGEGQ